MRLTMLPRYDALAASSRLRMAQYLPHLRDAGIEAVVRPLFDRAYVEALYSGRARPGIAGALVRRLRDLRAARGDAIWLEAEALPWLPWALERAAWPDVPVVSDHDDAVFHRYDMHGRASVRRLLGAKIDGVMAASRIVLAGNDYIAERARRAGAGRVEVVPTVVDLDRYALHSSPKNGNQSSEKIGPLRVGWIGTPVTWAAYGAGLWRDLAETLAEAGATFRAVGAGADPAPGLEIVDWSEESEADAIRAMDVGVMPLDDTPWSRGKCGYKLIQYMACGLPVVASPVGVNARIVTTGETGFLASTPAEWRDAVARLLADPALRARMGAAGRARVERDYSLQAWGPRVAALLKAAA